MRDNTSLIDYVLGVDLGQAADYTALVLIEVVWGHWQWDAWKRREEIEYDKEDWRYHVVYLERLPLGTSYPDIAEHIRDLMHQLPTKGKGSLDVYGDGETRVWLAVDAAGVGAPVVDMLRQHGLRPVAITIHGGDAEHHDERGWHVPKRNLISAVQVKLQQKRLRFAKSLPDVDLLTHELLNYRYKISDSGHDSYNAREGEQDDLVLALACARWYAEKAHSNVVQPLDEDIAHLIMYGWWR